MHFSPFLSPSADPKIISRSQSPPSSEFTFPFFSHRSRYSLGFIIFSFSLLPLFFFFLSKILSYSSVYASATSPSSYKRTYTYRSLIERFSQPFRKKEAFAAFSRVLSRFSFSLSLFLPPPLSLSRTPAAKSFFHCNETNLTKLCDIKFLAFEGT